MGSFSRIRLGKDSAPLEEDYTVGKDEGQIRIVQGDHHRKVPFTGKSLNGGEDLHLMFQVEVSRGLIKEQDRSLLE